MQSKIQIQNEIFFGYNFTIYVYSCIKSKTTLFSGPTSNKHGNINYPVTGFFTEFFQTVLKIVYNAP